MVKKLFPILLFLIVSAVPAMAQAPGASQHGVLASWTAASQGSDVNPIAGYNVYRCTGTCVTSSGTWTKANSSLVLGTSFLDPAAGLSVSTTYSYVVYTVDSIGNTSGPSNVATVAIPSSFPSNPNTPTNPTATVQ